MPQSQTEELINLNNIRVEGSLNVLGESFELLPTLMPSFDESIFNSLADAIVVVNSALIIERVNRSALKLTGYLENELVGRSATELTTNNRLTEKFLNRTLTGRETLDRHE